MRAKLGRYAGSGPSDPGAPRDARAKLYLVHVKVVPLGMVSLNAPLPTDAYVPILKAKMAEYGAIESCNSQRLVPLLEVLDPGASVKAISRAWPHPDRALWIHSLNIEGISEADFASSMEALFASLRSTTGAVPVVTVAEGPDVLAAVSRIINSDRHGVVLRVDAEDVLDASIDTSADIRETLDELGVTLGVSDLVLDCAFVEGAASLRAAVAEKCLQSLPSLSDWRSVVVAFSAFPPQVADLVPKSSTRAIPRTDARAFATLNANFDRTLIYGDYAIGVPTYASVPFAPIPNIRYASDDSWIIHRGKERRDPSSQYRSLTKDLVAAPYYSGPTFSPGDQQIHDVASGASGPGNAMTHLRAGVSRHIHVVLERLASLGEP